MTINTSWTKSTRSGSNGGQCVEVRRHGGKLQVRDSKNTNGPVLIFAPNEWRAFIAGAKDGEFDLQLNFD